MPQALNLITNLHNSTKRQYLPRMTDDKVTCMDVAREYGQAFWDGDRRFGYGGHHYDGRWASVAEKLIDIYKLNNNSHILDVGCGKGYLLYEIKQLLPNCTIVGMDISEYALKDAKPEIAEYLVHHDARDKLNFADKHFDLVLSLTTLHNLILPELVQALSEIARVGKHAYVVIEGYRNTQELFNLQCWALTCESFFRPQEWEYIFNLANYEGDFDFIFFEGA